MIMEETRLREQLVKLAASLFKRGFSVGSGGNISVRLPDGTFLATPTGSSLGRLEADKLSHVSADGKLLGGARPSKECTFHLQIYKNRLNCGAVVHLHSTYATALSCRGDLNPENAIRPFTPYYVMQIGRLPLIPYYKPGSEELFDAIAKMSVEHSALLLANHGQVTMGDTLEAAVNKAEELEETTKLLFILQAAGADIRYLTEAEISQLS